MQCSFFKNQFEFMNLLVFLYQGFFPSGQLLLEILDLEGETLPRLEVLHEIPFAFQNIILIEEFNFL